jgi:uncharacterized protein YndB with AHSA1/START domain
VINPNSVLEREVHIAARPEIVYSFFVDPAKLIRWKGIRAQLDPQPGGLYRLDINGRDVASGVYVALEPPTRLVVTWGWEGENSSLPPGTSTVEITLTPQGSDTVLNLKHTGLDGEHYHMQAMGWDHFLPRLVIAAAGGDPGSDPLVNVS